MPILNQPFQGQLGNVLIDKIENYVILALLFFLPSPKTVVYSD